jgi:Phospholipase_D-nuclease N-terminal/Short C-terminal domain
MVATTFWETFFLFLLFLPLAMTWGFAVIDIFRRDDFGGWSKALWLTCVILVPFFGTLIYLIARPAGATREERAAMEEANRDFVARYSPGSGVSELSALADLHDRGKLTDDEFAAEKARVLGSQPAVAVPA